nr:cation-transporting P-type ATPase [Roseibacterium persicicum]
MTAAEVAAARAAHGWNALPEPPAVSALAVLARQVTGLLVLMLVGAGLIALALGEHIDALAIGAVVVLNAALGFAQEWKAERAMLALRAMMAPQATVIRDGREQAIPARELVPGDLLLLAEGDRVPADAEILAEAGLRLDESVLTGESVPVSKPPGETAFGGTTVTGGHAEARVTRIGAATEFGQVAELTGRVERGPTTLQRALGQLARQLGWIALAVAGLVAAMGAWRGLETLQVVMLGLSMAVAMVPEGLPAVVTVTLALGAGAMARRNALVRHLQAVETLGAASVICTDKTGTLTENAMTVRQVWTAAGSYTATGRGHDPTGHVETGGAKRRAGDDPLLAQLCEVALGCTHARLSRAGERWEALGDPTEVALIVLAHKAWAAAPDPDALMEELPFTSERKRMSVLVRGTPANRVLTKGAPELVLEHCSRIATAGGAVPLTPARAEEVRAVATALAEEGLRVIALAARDTDEDRIAETDLTLLGLAGLIDPPRAGVAEAIAAAQAAGIRTVMITGDHPATAQAIARSLGLPAETVVTGAEVAAMDDAALSATVAGPVAFARVSPGDKLRIIAALQARGETVGMTGDGVNDAPALRRADIGIAMGIRGTEVAKDAADLVLLDDNYATIVGAIAEGRRQFDNTRKFVRYLLASNAGEVVALLVNTAMRAPLIFLPTQILWMNLITDGVTAVALGLEPPEGAQMRDPPRPRATRILPLSSLPLILGFGLYTGLASLWIFERLLPQGEDLARTAAFTAMVVFEKASVFAFRSLRTPGWRLGYLGNPALLVAFAAMLALQVVAVYWAPLQVLLQTVPIGWAEWGLIAGLALPLLVVPELWKTLRRGR